MTGTSTTLSATPPPPVVTPVLGHRPALADPRTKRTGPVSRWVWDLTPGALPYTRSGAGLPTAMRGYWVLGEVAGPGEGPPFPSLTPGYRSLHRSKPPTSDDDHNLMWGLKETSILPHGNRRRNIV